MQVSAAAVLYELSSQYKRQPDVLSVLPLMLRVLDVEDPDWAGIKKAHAYIATAIRNLVLFSDENKKESVKSVIHNPILRPSLGRSFDSWNLCLADR